MVKDIPLSVMKVITSFTDLFSLVEIYPNEEIDQAFNKIKELYKDEPDCLPTVVRILQILKEYRNS